MNAFQQLTTVSQSTVVTNIHLREFLARVRHTPSYTWYRLVAAALLCLNCAGTCIDPALDTLTYCLKVAEGDQEVSAEQRKRLQDMADFTATMDRWYGQMQTLPTSTLSKLISMGDRVVGLLNIGRKKS